MADQIISRKDALAKGLKRYFTGKPCKHGHIGKRYVIDWGCQICKASIATRWYETHRAKALKAREVDSRFITRKDARVKGLKKYFNGRPCKNGHLSERFVSGSGCLICRKEKCKTDERYKQALRRGAIKYYYANREKNLERRRKWLANNLERGRARARQYYWDNREKNIKRMREQYRLNPEKFRKQSNDWAKSHPEVICEHARKRRARKSGAQGSYTKADLENILKLQKNRCAHCRSSFGASLKSTLDHIIALSKGGSNFPRNLQYLCGPCNSKKKDQDPIDFARANGRLL